MKNGRIKIYFIDSGFYDFRRSWRKTVDFDRALRRLNYYPTIFTSYANFVTTTTGLFF